MNLECLLHLTGGITSERRALLGFCFTDYIYTKKLKFSLLLTLENPGRTLNVLRINKIV